ncbi:MAG: YesL family protein [Lachnospiraceae bacterium]|nr:YesL family protein [Lachnospiraceae bacterium]
MGKLFNYDNPVWRVVGMVADFFLLTVLWAICSLPIITIGASTTALFYVALKMADNKESYIVKTYFKAFKDNFVQSTILWVIMAVIGYVLAYGIYVCYQLDLQMATVYFWIFFVLACLYIMMLMVLFALAARLATGIGNMFMMTFMVCLKNFSWVFFMAVMLVCILALGIFVFWPILALAVGGIAFLQAKVYRHIIFPKYNWNLEE